MRASPVRLSVWGRFFTSVFGPCHGSDTQTPRNFQQLLVKGQKPGAGDQCGGNKVDIYPADSGPGKVSVLYKVQYLPMFRDFNSRQIGKEIHDLCPVPDSAQSKLPDDKRMDQDLGVLQQMLQNLAAIAKVVYPNGRVDERHLPIP
jgi:hypothetical protein